MTPFGTYPAPDSVTRTVVDSALPSPAGTAVAAPSSRRQNTPPARRASATDSLSGTTPSRHLASDAETVTTDTLPGQFADSLQTLPRLQDGYLPVAPNVVFGALSTTAPTAAPPPAAAPTLTSNALFQSLVLLFAATYALMLYRHMGDIRLLLGRILRGGATGNRLGDDPGGSGLPRFLHVTAAAGILFVGILAVKYGDPFIPQALGEAMPRSAVLLLLFGASLAFAGIMLYQAATLGIAGSVTLSQPFTGQLLLLKRTYFALVVLTLSPPLLFYALCPPGTGSVWFYVIAIELLLTVLLYLRETLHLFISKKISILHWFLYLCIVEIFPLSLLWLLAAR